ncbi:MAG: MYXO-CTERM sorting domain-containing protein [Kofleriaceae bacterium]
MTNTKFAVTLLLGAGLFGSSVAIADVGGATVLKVFGSSTKDVATQVTTGTSTTAARLRHHQNNQPGHEQPAMAMFVGPNGDNKTGLYFDRASNLFVPGSSVATLKPVDNGNGTNDGNPAQGAMAMFQLVNTGCAAGGGGGGGGTGGGTGGGAGSPVCASLVSTYTPAFITSHASQDYRAFNQPNAYTINGGSAIAIEYNWRQNNNGARTTRWLQVFNAQGQQILFNTQTNKLGEQQIYAKNNDDCNMNMDGHAGVVADFGPAANFSTTATTGFTSHVVMWRGCNGNGADNGWMDVMDITCNDDKNPTQCKWADKFDIALDQQEERSRGYCSVDAANKNTAVCSWTAGNDQPQTKGVWLAAADITPGKYTGTDKQSAVLWSKLIDGRKPAANGIPSTYAERAMHERVMVYNPTTKALEPSSYIIWRSGDAYGSNNNNNKGGTYYRNNIGLFQIDAATNALKTVVPLTDMSQKMLGLDGTHLGVSSVVFGGTDTLAAQKPGLMLFTGSQNGGGTPAQINFLALDTAPGMASAPAALGVAGTASSGGASYDRSMYSNYLGQNPGNQGRNFSASLSVINPFCADGGATKCDKLLTIMATTGKDSAEVANVSVTPVQDTCYASDDTTHTTPFKCAQLKLSSYITVIPVAQANAAAGMGSGSGDSGTGTTGTGTGDGGGTGGAGSNELGGCSTTSGAGTASAFFLIGFAAFIRRRRVEEN